VIDIPLKEQPAGAADGCLAGRSWQSLGSTVFWAVATLAGILYIFAVLCLCAYAPLHFTVLLAQRTSMVRSSETNPKPFRRTREMGRELLGVELSFKRLVCCACALVWPALSRTAGTAHPHGA